MGDILFEIQGKLREIENKENIKILLAAESGSRAWGFASPDSDYDVRFIYLRRTKDYLRLDGLKDTIDWQLDEVLDINGWDLKKALIHFKKGNATLFEWANSPVIYKTVSYTHLDVYKRQIPRNAPWSSFRMPCVTRSDRSCLPECRMTRNARQNFLYS